MASREVSRREPDVHQHLHYYEAPKQPPLTFSEDGRLRTRSVWDEIFGFPFLLFICVFFAAVPALGVASLVMGDAYHATGSMWVLGIAVGLIAWPFITVAIYFAILIVLYIICTPVVIAGWMIKKLTGH